MKKLLVTTLVLANMLLLSAPVKADTADLDIRILKAKKVFHEMNQDPKRAIPPEILSRSRAVIIFPTYLKAGFLYAARYGVGVAMARDEETGRWSPPVFVRVSGGSFGYQAGFNSMDLVLVGRDKFTFHDYNEGGPTISGTATATAGTWGVHSELGTGWKLNSAMHWFSKNRGLFAALATEGSVFSFDEEANHYYYGDGANTEEIFFGNTVKAKATGQMLMDAITDWERLAGTEQDPYIETAWERR